MFIVPISKMPSIGSLEQLQPIQQAPGIASGGLPFADMLTEAMDAMRETQAQSQQDGINLALGQMDDLHTMQINSQKAAMAMEFTTELTTRAVNAYNEVLRMQI